MPKCKICGQPVTAAPVFHPACWQTQAEKVAAEFCDHYCQFPLTAKDEDTLHEAHCSKCPMAQLFNLGV